MGVEICHSAWNAGVSDIWGMASVEKEPLRVLHLASWYPTAVHGTLGNFVQRHVEAVATMHRCEVLAAVEDAGVGSVVRFTEDRPGGAGREPIRTHRIHVPPRRPHAFFATRALVDLGRTLERPDLIHLHVAYPAGAAARRLAAYWGVPLVLTEHWTVYGRTAWADCPAWRRWDMRRTGAAADCICPVTRGLGEDMQAAGVGRNGLFVPVPNVVDTGLFHPQEPGAGEEPLTLLHISSLVDHHKNISGLLRALAMCLPELPGLRVRIIGDGDPEPHRRFAEALGIGDRIHWGTEIPLAQVAAEMRQAHALVLFSHFENFPCVIGEAWASGIPVFATRVGGIAEYLDAAHGALVERGDEAGLARVLRDWVNGRRWDPVRLRSTATDRFSLPAVAEAYDRVYRTLLDPAEGSQPVRR